MGEWLDPQETPDESVGLTLCSAAGVVTLEKSEDISDGVTLCPEGNDGLAASENT